MRPCLGRRSRQGGEASTAAQEAKQRSKHGSEARKIERKWTRISRDDADRGLYGRWVGWEPTAVHATSACILLICVHLRLAWLFLLRRGRRARGVGKGMPRRRGARACGDGRGSAGHAAGGWRYALAGGSSPGAAVYDLAWGYEGRSAAPCCGTPHPGPLPQGEREKIRSRLVAAGLVLTPVPAVRLSFGRLLGCPGGVTCRIRLSAALRRRARLAWRLGRRG